MSSFCDSTLGFMFRSVSDNRFVAAHRGTVRMIRKPRNFFGKIEELRFLILYKKKAVLARIRGANDREIFLGCREPKKIARHRFRS